jgi:hypothetical protein
MIDTTYSIRFKPSTLVADTTVIAASVEIQGEHLILLDSQRKLAALVLLELVDSWSEIPDPNNVSII